MQLVLHVRVCESTSWYFSDTSYSQELGKPKFTPDAALTCGACFFSALFILQPQPVPVRCKIRSTRVAVSFCSLLIVFSSFHTMFKLIFQKIIERMVVQGSACSLLCGDCIFSVPTSYSSHQFFLPQNLDMSKVKICRKIQFKIVSKISSRTSWANLKMCVVLCSDSCLLCNSPSGSFISCAASLHIWNLP